MKVLVWDLPLRLFHWLLAAAFVAAFAIATLSSDDGGLFPLHAVIGLAIPFLIALRIVWGVIGSRWARFGSLTFNPRKLAAYFRDALSKSESEPYTGHNPATSYFMLAALLLLAGLGVTGFLMARGNESAEDLHEVLAWTMAALVAFHVAGVVWHRVRHRENLALAMIDGRKRGNPNDQIRSARTGSAVILLALTALWGAMLINGYDGATQRLTLPFLATPLQIGEAEGQEGEKQGTNAVSPQHDADGEHESDDDD